MSSGVRLESNVQLAVVLCEQFRLPDNSELGAESLVCHWYVDLPNGANDHYNSEPFVPGREFQLDWCAFLVVEKEVEVGLRFTVADTAGNHLGAWFGSLHDLASSEQFDVKELELQNVHGEVARVTVSAAVQVRWSHPSAPAHELGTCRYLVAREDLQAKHIWGVLFPNREPPSCAPVSPMNSCMSPKAPQSPQLLNNVADEPFEAHAGNATISRNEHVPNVEDPLGAVGMGPLSITESAKLTADADANQDHAEYHLQGCDAKPKNPGGSSGVRRRRSSVSSRGSRARRPSRLHSSTKASPTDDQLPEPSVPWEEDDEHKVEQAKHEVKELEKRFDSQRIIEYEDVKRHGVIHASVIEKENGNMNMPACVAAIAGSVSQSEGRKISIEQEKCSSQNDFDHFEVPGSDDGDLPFSPHIQGSHFSDTPQLLSSAARLAAIEKKMHESLNGVTEPGPQRHQCQPQRSNPSASEHQTPQRLPWSSRKPSSQGRARDAARHELWSSSPVRAWGSPVRLTSEHGSSPRILSKPNSGRLSTSPARVTRGHTTAAPAQENHIKLGRYDITCDVNDGRCGLGESQSTCESEREVNHAVAPAGALALPHQKIQQEYRGATVSMGRTHESNTESLRHFPTTGSETIKQEADVHSATLDPKAQSVTKEEAMSVYWQQTPLLPRPSVVSRRRRVFRVLTSALGVRVGPDVSSARTGTILLRGDIFEASVIAPGVDGRVYLKLAGARGWVFDDSSIDSADPSVEEAPEAEGDLPSPLSAHCSRYRPGTSWCSQRSTGPRSGCSSPTAAIFSQDPQQQPSPRPSTCDAGMSGRCMLDALEPCPLQSQAVFPPSRTHGPVPNAWFAVSSAAGATSGMRSSVASAGRGRLDLSGSSKPTSPDAPSLSLPFREAMGGCGSGGATRRPLVDVGCEMQALTA